ncbi:uncharacterized protein [Diadema antillarum]|uniref:uncharacterized protein isoform X1 n=1 Tax=Diadema antillarum TaxID=105358 RepID=UPI003A866AC9
MRISTSFPENMELMTVSTPLRATRYGLDVCPEPGYAGGENGRGVTPLPNGLHIMFWCFVAVLCGTLQLSTGASTATMSATTTTGTAPIVTTLVLEVPEEHLYSNEALLEWTLTTVDPPLSKVINYYVTFQLEGSNSKTVITVDPAFTSETLRNLEPNEPYRAFVKAVFNDSDTPFVNSELKRFTTPEKKYRSSSMGPKEFVILFTIFALWGMAMMRFFCTWNKKMNLRVTKDTMRTRDVSPTHRHLEAYKSHFQKKVHGERSSQRPLTGDKEKGLGGRTWQRGSQTMKSFRARASNFSRRSKFGASKSSAPPSPMNQRVIPECEPLRATEILGEPPTRQELLQRQQKLPPRSQSHAAAAAAAAVVVGVPVHVSYQAAGDGSATVTGPPSPERSGQSVI